RRRHTRWPRDWSSDVCSSDLDPVLIAYRDAGADVVYAPGLADLDRIAAVVEAVAVPVNVLALPNGPSVPELASVGVRRVSTGGEIGRASCREREWRTGGGGYC